ncbi:MAG: hypothetical protein KGO81_12405, partial [Bacteroidota bacterium]|nr:hypothetical protein [Bacteroidota bacterium]
MKKRILQFYTIAMCLLFASTKTFATNYYVDPSSTASTTNGTVSYPFKSITQLNNSVSSLNPGDMVLFKKGQSFSGRIYVPSSGTATSPIIYSSYGTGNMPVFNNAITDIINISNKQYVIIDGIQFIDSTLISDNAHAITANMSYAINIDNSPNCTVRNCDISLAGIGISVTAGSNNTTITGNNIHNLRMVVNTPTSVNANDDYGANPIVVGTSNNTISYNTFSECWALSYDYGYDGGAVEIFGSTISNNNILYNTAINCNGFTEIGSSSSGTCNNNIIAYNKMINCGIIGTFQNSGTFAISINNLQYYNNTVVETVEQYSKPNSMFWSAASGPSGMVVVKNNIFLLASGTNFVTNSSNFNSGQMVHSNNIFRMTSGSLGITLNSTELSNSALNLFTSASGDPSAWNYYPLSTSPAINFGTNVGLTKDFAGNAIVGNPDAGILEYITSTTPSLSATSTAGTISCNGGTTTVTVSASGGVTPYTGTGTFTVSAGTYSYTVTDANGAKATTTVTVTEPSALTATVTAGTISVAGGSTSVTINASGGTSPYQYSFNSSAYQTSNIFNNVTAGTYAVAEKDANGCSATQSITIAQPSSLSATSTAGTISCHGGTTTVTVSASGGVTPYTGTGTFTVSAGTYSYTVTDANGAKATTTVTVTEPSALT